MTLRFQAHFNPSRGIPRRRQDVGGWSVSASLCSILVASSVSPYPCFHYPREPEVFPRHRLRLLFFSPWLIRHAVDKTVSYTSGPTRLPGARCLKVSHPHSSGSFNFLQAFVHACKVPLLYVHFGSASTFGAKTTSSSSHTAICQPTNGFRVFSVSGHCVLFSPWRTGHFDSSHVSVKGQQI